MKKISLKTLNLKEIETLTREQLRDVLGGSFMATYDFGTTTTETCISSCENLEEECKTTNCKIGSCNYRGGHLACVVI